VKIRNLFRGFQWPWTKKKAAPLPLPTGYASGPLQLAPARAPRSALTLRDMGEVPQHVTDYIHALPSLRTDSLLDGLIGDTTSSGATYGGGWQNPLTGMGTGRDKSIYSTYFEPIRIDDPTLAALWNGNDIAKRIVGARIKEMFRRGWVMNLPGSPGPKNTTPGQDGKGGAAPLAKQDSPPVAPASKAPPTPAPANDGAAAGPLPKEKKNRTDSIDPPELDRPNANGMPATSTPPDPHADQGESGPTAPGPEAVPGKDLKTPPAGDQNNNADIATEAEKYAKRLNYMAKMRESSVFGALFGGLVLIMGIDDGQEMSQPVDEKNIKSVQFLTPIDRRFVVAHTYYEMIGPRYGDVEVYNVINPFGNQSNQYIHETRVLRFEGAAVDLLMRRRLAGWTLSTLQAPIDTMRTFDQSQQSVGALMTDLAQAVMSINGLAQMISSDPTTLQTRMQLVDMSRSSSRMIYIDAQNEKFERKPTPLTGVADVINMQMLRLAAAAEMPVALLFGREPSGLNATGDADFRRFYDLVAGDQREILEPKLQYLFKMIFLAKDGPTKGQLPPGDITFTFHKLYEPTELEQSTIRFNMAQADDLYINNGTLLPEEVAMSRFRSGDLHLDTEIQGDLRREKLASAELAPSGAEKAKAEQANKDADRQVAQAGNDIKAKAVDSKGPPGAPPAK
jgi:phage-related protein (TIGR01555 family)